MDKNLWAWVIDFPLSRRNLDRARRELERSGWHASLFLVGELVPRSDSSEELCSLGVRFPQGENLMNSYRLSETSSRGGTENSQNCTT